MAGQSSWGGRVVARKRAAVVARWGNVCHLCGTSISLQLRAPHPLSLSLDHVIPRSQGGSDSVENLAPSHLRCNLRKGTKTTPTPRLTTTPPPRQRRPPESGASFFREG